MKVISFHLNHFSIRGTEVAVYDYAHYNETILKNKSIIVVDSRFRSRRDYRGVGVHNDEVYKKFHSRFDIVEYIDIDDLNRLLKLYKVDIFYNLKSGENDGFILPLVKNVNHCIFTYNKTNVHGDVYIPISPSIVDRSIRHVTPHIPHIVTMPNLTSDMRDELKIPRNALVFGRHGGMESFNVEFVHSVVENIASVDKDIYFIFLNTLNFCREKRDNIIFLDGIVDSNDKARFINTCDAMLHARMEGESFGLSIAEFSIMKKPIISYVPEDKTNYHSHHVDVLGDVGIYYKNSNELTSILTNFKSIDKNKLDRYSAICSPQYVMELFSRYVVMTNSSIYNSISTSLIKNKSYIYSDKYNTNDIYKYVNLLLKSGSVYIDIGAKCGYNTILVSRDDVKIVSIEHELDTFNILKSNVSTYCMKNVICINNSVSLSKDHVDIDYLMKSYNNVGVISIDVENDDTKKEILKTCINTLITNRPYIIVTGSISSSTSTILKCLKYSNVTIEDYTICYHIDTKNEFDSRVNVNIDKSIRVKLLCNWTTSLDLCRCWDKMSKGNCKWNSIQVTHEDIDIDYYVIVNKPREGDYYIPEKTIVFRMEPDTETSPHWNDWYRSKDQFMYFLDLSKFRNNTEWHLDLNYNDMSNSIQKTKLISTVVSSLYNMEGHKKRIDFIKYLEKENIDIDIYGRDNLFQFSRYVGELPYHNKNDGILPYKYSFIAENCKMKNYFTEKLIDCILGETLCFYWGCPNVDDFIDSNAYIELDLNDFEKSIHTILRCIKNDEWSRRIDTIRKEKKKIVEYYSFFPRIEGLIRLKNVDCRVVNLDRRVDRWTNFKSEADRVGFTRYSRFSAIDGSSLESTDYLKDMFRKFPRKVKSGEMGCALSHLSIWEGIEKDTLVLEDDIKFVDNFIDKLSFLYNYVKNQEIDFDVIFIGYHLNDDVVKEKKINKDLIFDRDRILLPMKEITNYKTEDHMFGYHGGGTFGYILSQSGSKKLLESVKINGFVWPVDYHMLICSTIGLNIHCVTDRLVTSNIYDKSNAIDTDIQNTTCIF